MYWKPHLAGKMGPRENVRWVEQVVPGVEEKAAATVHLKSPKWPIGAKRVVRAQ